MQMKNRMKNKFKTMVVKVLWLIDLIKLAVTSRQYHKSGLRSGWIINCCQNDHYEFRWDGLNLLYVALLRAQTRLNLKL